MKDVMIKKNTRGLLLLAACLVTAVTAQAQKVISVNVHNDQGTPSPMTDTDIAGAEHRVANWNNLAPSKFYAASNAGQNWKYNDGSLIGETFSVTSGLHSTAVTPAAGTNDAALFSGLSELQNATPLTFSLSNIPFAQYKIYVYAGRGPSWGQWGGSVNIGSETYYVKNTDLPTDENGYVKATTTSVSGDPVTDWANVATGNYVLFDSLSGGSQTITFTALNYGTASPNEYRFNVYGFQIVEIPSGPSVPEPANVAILVGVIGLAGAISFRRVTRNRL